MTFQQLMDLRRSGRLPRFHTEYFHGVQTVGEHTHQMLVLLVRYCDREVLNFRLMVAAVNHDLGECFAGDLPAPVKWRFPRLAEVQSEVEGVIRLELGVGEVTLLESEKQWLKWADSIEAMFTILEQRRMGNRTLDEGFWHIYEYLLKPETLPHSRTLDTRHLLAELATDMIKLGSTPPLHSKEIL